MNSLKTLARGIAAALGIALAAGAAQAQTVGTTFPSGFFASTDASTGTPWIGFGGYHDKLNGGPVNRTPVIILHGNDGTPYYTGCGRFSMDVHGFANYLANSGAYTASELWALGWQGTQCDQATMGWTKSASAEHTITANVPDLRNFVAQVLRYTGAAQVDIVAHGMGVVLAREWARQDRARGIVRRFVAIDGPNQGMIICSDPAVTGNSWASSFSGGFTPTSPVCQELGSPNTPFLTTLNRAGESVRSISPADTLVLRNADSSFPYMPWQDGLGIQGVPSVDIYGNAVDLTNSATIRGAQTTDMRWQHTYDSFSNTAHVGIANSPETWLRALIWLTK